MPEPVVPLRFVALGIGDAFTSEHNNASVLVVAGEERMLVDVPDPPRKVLWEAGIRAESVTGVFLTHIHGDHANGIEPLGFYFKHVIGRKLPVYSAGEVTAKLLEKLTPSMQKPEDYLECHVLARTTANPVRGLVVEVKRTIHPVECYAYKIHFGGRTLAISADTGWDAGVESFLATGDIILHEVSAVASRYHTPLEKLRTLPDATRRKVRLTHLPDDLGPTGDLAKLEQGKVYEV